MDVSNIKIKGEDMVAIEISCSKKSKDGYVTRLIGPDFGDGLRREFAERISAKKNKIVFAVKKADLPALLEIQEFEKSVHGKPGRPFHIFMMPSGSYENVPFLEITHYLPKEYPGKDFRITQVSGVTVPLPVDEIDNKSD